MLKAREIFVNTKKRLRGAQMIRREDEYDVPVGVSFDEAGLYKVHRRHIGVSALYDVPVGFCF